MRYGILFDEEDSRKIDDLMKYCELNTVNQLFEYAIETMFHVIEAENE